MIRLFESDWDYLDWCATHVDRYVLNANRSLSPGSIVIHKACCRLITQPRPGADPGGFVEGQYLKVGAGTPGALRNWARKKRLAQSGKLDGIARECQACM